MKFECQACGGSVEYSTQLDKMVCAFCGCIFDVGEFDLAQEREAKAPDVVPIMAQDIMEYRVFSCASCGAEILINGVESSKFCAYCGQPAISFDRIAGELKPDYIIPFKVTKEYAMEKMSETIRKAKIQPEKIENFEVEYLRGIYMPYRLYDIEYYDDQVWRAKKEGGYMRSSKSYHRRVRYTFKDLGIPTASRLNDEISQRLEPFDTTAKVPFDSEYLSGYYADRYDKSAEETNLAVMAKAKKLFNAGVCRTIDSSNPGKLSFTNPEVEMLKSSYVLVPVWFMTVKLDGEVYTMTMNGQTGKIAGALPVWKTREFFSFAALFTMFLMITVSVFSYLMNMKAAGEQTGYTVLYSILLLFIIVLTPFTYFKFYGVRKTYQRMRSRGLSSMVRER